MRPLGARLAAGALLLLAPGCAFPGLARHRTESPGSPAPPLVQWPAGGPGPVTVRFEGGKDQGQPICDHRGTAVAYDTLSPFRPLPWIAAHSRLIVLADAVQQSYYWSRAPEEANPGEGGWSAWTATNYIVVQTIKGPAFHAVQTREVGIPVNLAAGALPCIERATRIVNDQPALVGRRYILFDYLGWPSPAPNVIAYTSASQRYYVTDGIVHSQADDGKTEAFPLAPQPLALFVRSLGLQ